MNDALIRQTIYLDITAERTRQQLLKSTGRFKYTIADPELNDYERLAIIMEEIGEVSTAVLEKTKLCAAREKKSFFSFLPWFKPKKKESTDLRSELLQSAACCIGFIEYLDKKELESIDGR